MMLVGIGLSGLSGFRSIVKESEPILSESMVSTQNKTVSLTL